MTASVSCTAMPLASVIVVLLLVRTGTRTPHKERNRSSIEALGTSPGSHYRGPASLLPACARPCPLSCCVTRDERGAPPWRRIRSSRCGEGERPGGHSPSPHVIGEGRVAG